MVKNRVHGDVSPAVRGLGEKHRRQSRFHISEFGRQRINRHNFHLFGIQIGEQRAREQRPSANHGHAVYVGIGILDSQHFCSGVLRCFGVVKRIDDGDAGVFGGRLTHASHPRLQIWRVLVARNDGNLPLATHLRRQLVHHLHTHLCVVAAVKRKTFGIGHVAVKRHHGHTAINGLVHRATDLAGVTGREQNRVGAGVHRLSNALRLHRAVFVGRSKPVDFYGDSVRRGQFGRSGIGALASRKKHRVGRALGDHGDRKRLGRRGIDVLNRVGATAAGVDGEGAKQQRAGQGESKLRKPCTHGNSGERLMTPTCLRRSRKTVRTTA